MRKRVVSMLLSLILLLTAVDFPVFAENAVASLSITDSYYRNTNVTSVKDQEEYGLCWAFSTIAACEAELLQNNGANSSLDLSELHLGYYGFNRSGDPLGNYSDASNQLQTIKPWYEAGHNQYAAMNALASWGGVVDESTAPYSTGYTLFEGKNSSELAELEYGQDTYHLENTYMVHKDNLADVKQAILNYGGVVMGFCADEGYMTTEEFYDTTNNSLYHPEHKNTSHEAFVVGWDDNFDKFSNPGGHVPSAPGAWIVKNSWGSATNDEGYFYISYYDQTISTWMFAYDMESADNYDNNYQYESDISGIIRSDNGETQSQESVYEITPSNMYKNISANVFEAGANPSGYETLEAISFFSYATEGTYTVKIYTNLDDDSNPMSGTLEDTITGDFRYGGYRTIPTSHPIILREGTKYSVVVDIVDAEGNHLGVSSANSDFGIDNKATAGRSFYAETSSTGIYWRDLSDYSQSYVQIKAFTNNQTSATPTGLTLDKTELYMATSSTGEWLSATPTPSGAKYAKVTWSSANESIAKVTAGGKVIPVAEGDVTITASTADGSVSQTCLVHVKTAPTAVSKLTASQKPAGVSWTPVEGVDGYNFYVSLTEQGDYQKAGSVPNQSDVATITAAPTGLSQGYRYYIYVKSYKEIDGHQYESVASDYTFYTEPIDAPANFKATKITKDAVTVTWDSVAAATGYSPRCYDTGDTSAFVETNQYTFTGLEKGKSYTFYVYACGQLVNSSRVLSDGVSVKVTTADDENEVFDITYNLDGGTNNSSNPATYTKTTETIKLANPTRTGYAFAGWYSDAAYTTKVTQIAKGSTGDKTFYAKWTPNSYTIKFNGNGASSGSMSSMTNCKYGTKYTLPSNAFKKPGYYFAGWNTKADGSGTTYANKASVMNLTSRSGGSVTLYAQWKIPTYTIAYHGNGSTSGTMSAKKGCKYGTSYTLSANAYRRSGYSFTGWNTKADGSGKAYANKATVKNLSSSNGSTVTLYAQWKKIKYTISYNLNGGTNNSSNPTGYYVTSSTITLKNPTRRGYTFVGWYSDSQYKNKVTQIAKGSVGNKTLYARWTATKYKITYNLNGGTNNSKNPATYTIASSNITLQSPTRRGYSFGGWYSDSGYKNRVTQIAKGSVGNKTLYAKWNVVTYKITYNLNSGTNNSKNPTSYKVTTSTITLQNPTRRGYTFGGWYSDSGYKNQVTQIAKGSVGNKTLYAKWTKTKYAITYNLNGGTNNSKNPTYYFITSNTITLQNPTKTGYTFGGWYSDSGYKTRVKEITKGSVGKKTLYAKWIAK